MQYHLTTDWEDTGIFSVFRSPFLVPSIILHAFLMLFVLRTISLNLTSQDQETPITVQLTEFREGGSVSRSIGPARGPGGPRALPKSGTVAAAPPTTGKLDSGSMESSVPALSEEPPPPPKPVALPGPKVLAADTRTNYVKANETAPDSLVRLPTRAPATLPGNAASETVRQDSLASGKRGIEGPGIKALNEGTQIPGALKSSGTRPGPFGVPGGGNSGTGLAGGGTGSGSGGGSATGLKGTADYNYYFNQLKKRVQSVWKYPDGISGVQKVYVLFSLDRAGKLVQVEVLESSDSRLNASAVEAMRKASPFPPIPESLKDLANSPLRMEFTVEIRVRG